MTNFVYIAASLDGYIADPQGGIEWLNEFPNPEGSDYGWTEFLSGIDAISMGRKTFEKVLSFESWPYQLPIFVLSTSLQEIPASLIDKVEIIRGSPREVIELLHGRGFQNLYIDGGKTVQGFLAADLVDELIITRIPILLGKGISLFGELEDRLRFVHKGTDVYDNGLVQSRYQRSHK